MNYANHNTYFTVHCDHYSFLEETFHMSIKKYLEIKDAFPKLDSLLCVGNCTVKAPLGQSQHL